MKYIDLSIWLWKWEGRIVVGGTPQQFQAFAKKWIDADLNVGEHSAAHAYLAYGKPWLIWVESISNVPSLAHEALHVTFGMLEARGLKPTEASEEAYTYTMEAILRAALTAKRWARLR